MSADIHKRVKFRTWNPEKRVMTAGHDLETLFATTDKAFAGESILKAYQYLQWTGFTDSIESEVYEMDRIMVRSELTDVERPYIVEWDKIVGAWVLQPEIESFRRKSLSSVRKQDIRVVGHYWTELVHN